MSGFYDFLWKITFLDLFIALNATFGAEKNQNLKKGLFGDLKYLKMKNVWKNQVAILKTGFRKLRAVEGGLTPFVVLSNSSIKSNMHFIGNCNAFLTSYVFNIYFVTNCPIYFIFFLFTIFIFSGSWNS